ncbi:MAG: hypothetical protein ACRC6T_11965 [Sarcina sp.]
MNNVKAIIEVENIELEVNLNNVIRSINLKSPKKITIGDKTFDFGAFDCSNLKQFENTYTDLNQYLIKNKITDLESDIKDFDMFTFVAFKSYETKKLAIDFYKKLKATSLTKEETFDKILLELANFTDIKAFERMKNNAYILLFDFNNNDDIDYIEKVLEKDGLASIFARGVMWNFADLKSYFTRAFSLESTYPEFNVQFLKREN